MSKLILFLFIVSLTNIFWGQNDTLPEVEVEANGINSPSATYKVIPLELDNNTLNDVLTENTSIFIKSYGVGNLSTVSVRGGNASQTQIIWNGFSINSATLGQNDLSITSTSLIDAAAVHLGASSIVNSSGGLGGAIQLSNKTEFKKRIELSLIKELGSYGIDNTTLKLKAGNEKWQFYTGVAKKHADNDFKYRDFLQSEPQIVRQTNSKFDQLELAQNIYYNASTNHRFSLKTNFTTTQRLIPSIMGLESKGERQKDEVIKSSLEWSFNKKKYFQQIALGYFYDYLNYIDTTSAINSKVAINSFKGYYKGKYYINDSIQIRLSLNSEQFFAQSSGFDDEEKQLRNTLFIEYYQKLKNKLSYTLSVRKEAITNVSSPIVPALSLRWDKSKQHSVLFSVAQNFRAPTLNDLFWSPGGNPNLKPEEGIVSEIGYVFNKKKINYGLTGYYSLIQNWIQWLPTSKGYWEPQNIKEVESYGLEFSGAKKFKLGLIDAELKGTYNLVYSQNKESSIENDLSIGKQLIYVPKNVANVNLKLKLKSLSLSYQHSYTSKSYVDAINTVYMPYYAPASLSLGWRVSNRLAKSQLEIIVSVLNLYDEEYQVIANRPLPGRYFSITAKVNFKK